LSQVALCALRCVSEPGGAQPGRVVIPEAPRVAVQSPQAGERRRRYPSRS